MYNYIYRYVVNRWCSNNMSQHILLAVLTATFIGYLLVIQYVMDINMKIINTTELSGMLFMTLHSPSYNVDRMPHINIV